MIRAALTGWEILHPTQFTADSRITLAVSLKKIKGGAWYDEMKKAGRSIGEMLTTVHHELTMLDSQPYDQRMSEMYDFFTEVGTDCKFRWGFGHEPEPTLCVLKHNLIPEEHVGLLECQSYIVFTDDQRNIVGVIKFCPPATIK
ncbi:MAG: hypothetical protein PHY34_02560 [Patescibacteria group bacterium]|nr:hypothetical protein [Patescibacteria group bacterium]MDD5715474.1 hypothetical protein [Patescibacteria group bacterium]